jgi:hypothetical protein
MSAMPASLPRLPFAVRPHAIVGGRVAGKQKKPKLV